MALSHVETDEDFKSKVVDNKEDLIVVDFWAPWCMPCKGYSPIFEKVAKSGLKGVKFVKANIDELEKTTESMSIRSVPTTVIVRNGKVLDAKPGALTEDVLNEFVKAYK